MASNRSLQLFSNCRLTINDKISRNNDRLYKVITDQCQFKIIGITPLVIEKDCLSQLEIINLCDLLTEFVQEGDYDFISDAEEGRSCDSLDFEGNTNISGSMQASLIGVLENEKQYVKPSRKIARKVSHTNDIPSAKTSDTESGIQEITRRFQDFQIDGVTRDQQLDKLNELKTLNTVGEESHKSELQQQPQFVEATTLGRSLTNAIKEESFKRNSAVNLLENKHETKSNNKTDDLSKQGLSEHKTLESSPDQNVDIDTANMGKIHASGDNINFNETLSSLSEGNQNNTLKVVYNENSYEDQSNLASKKQERASSVENSIHILNSFDCLNSLSEMQPRGQEIHKKLFPQETKHYEKIGETCRTIPLSIDVEQTSRTDKECGKCKKKAVEKIKEQQNEKKELSKSLLRSNSSDFEKLAEVIENKKVGDKFTNETERYSSKGNINADLCTNTSSHFRDGRKVDDNELYKQELEQKERIQELSSFEQKHTENRQEVNQYSSKLHNQEAVSEEDTNKQTAKKHSSKFCDQEDTSSEPIQGKDKQTTKEHSSKPSNQEYASELDKDINKNAAKKHSSTLRHPENTSELDKDTNKQTAKEHSSTLHDQGDTSELDKDTNKQTAKKHSYKSSDQENTSESDEESHIMYSLNEPCFEMAKLHFQSPKFKFYFDSAEKDDTIITFKLNGNDKNCKVFMDKLKQLKYEVYELVYGENLNINTVIKKIMSEVNRATLYSQGRKLYITGIEEAVKEVRSKLCSIPDVQIKKCSMFSEKLTIKKDSNERLTTAEENLGEERNKNFSYDGKMKENSRGESGSYLEPTLTSYGADKQIDNTSLSLNRNGTSQFGGNSEASNRCCLVTAKCKINVRVYKTDITKLKVDCIVNAANKHLQHYGGVARAIADAAGLKLKMECEEFIGAGNLVAETNIFVSTGGNLPARNVMHAVGPKWYSYDEKSKHLCLQNLRQTVLRCLVEAKRRGMESIALPSISAAIFKVPKEFCAECYMLAVKNFDAICAGEISLREIHFVDVDTTMVEMIQKNFKKNLLEPCDPDVLQKDCEFARQHKYPSYQKDVSNLSKKSGSKDIFHQGPGSVGATAKATSSSDIKECYQIGKYVTLVVDNKHAFDHESDIVITIGEPFDKLSNYTEFNANSGTMNDISKWWIGKKVKTARYSLCKINSHQVFVIGPEPKDNDDIKKAFANLKEAFEKCCQSSRKIIVTSNILYSEPSYKQHKNSSKQICKKLVDKFTKHLVEFLSRDTYSKNITFVLVGNKEAVHKVTESVNFYENIKKIPPRDLNHEPSASASSRGKDSDRPSSMYDTKSSSSVPTEKKNFYRPEDDNDFHSERSASASSRGDSSDKPNHKYDEGNYRPEGAEGFGTSVDQKRECLICYDKKPCKLTECCKQLLCADCEKKMLQCPFCSRYWSIRLGDQPDGFMNVEVISVVCPGYYSSPTFKIEYKFPPGIQKAHHPNPEKPYSSAIRTAYLPACDDGFYVLRLLRIAFMRRLTFTIGTSRTTGSDDSIVWNDIHHKTRLNDASFGYPDPGYIARVVEELSNKGVTYNSLTFQEKNELGNFEHYIRAFRKFNDY